VRERERRLNLKNDQAALLFTVTIAKMLKCLQ